MKSKELAKKYSLQGYISFDFPDEWYAIVSKALNELSILPEWTNESISQVKSKFNMLRIYLKEPLASNIEAKAIINEAEIAVYKLASSKSHA